MAYPAPKSTMQAGKMGMGLQRLRPRHIMPTRMLPPLRRKRRRKRRTPRLMVMRRRVKRRRRRKRGIEMMRMERKRRKKRRKMMIKLIKLNFTRLRPCISCCFLIFVALFAFHFFSLARSCTTCVSGYVHYLFRGLFEDRK